MPVRGSFYLPLKKKKKEKKKKKLLSEKPASFRSTSMGIINSVDGPDALTICMTVKCQ